MTEQDSLRRATIDGVAVNLASQLIRFGLRFAYQIVIARLLLPADFGLVALITPVMAFVQLFTDLGLSQATIQQATISQAQLSFLFWVNAAAGASLAVVCVLAAPLVASFYGDPRVTLVMVASGGLLLLDGVYAQHMAVLNRHMRFRALAVLDLSAFLLGGLAAIAAAELGCGYWSILINQAVFALSTLVGAWRLARWRPGRPGRFEDMRPLLGFGGNVTGANIVFFFSRNSDNILIGRFVGEQALGLYDRAYKLVLLPFFQVSAPFSKVAVPLLSRSQDDPDFYRSAYRRMLHAILLLVYPGLVFMILDSHDLIVLALGERWAGVAPIFAILGIDAFVAPINTSLGWLFVSQGRTREMRNWGVAAALLFVGCFIIGLRWGPRGVAAGYAAAGLVEVISLAFVTTSRGPVRGRDFWPMLAPIALGTATCLAVVFGLHGLIAGLPGLGVLAAAAYASFVAGLAILPEGRRMLAETAGQIRRFAQAAAARRQPDTVPPPLPRS